MAPQSLNKFSAQKYYAQRGIQMLLLSYIEKSTFFAKMMALFALNFELTMVPVAHFLVSPRVDLNGATTVLLQLSIFSPTIGDG